MSTVEITVGVVAGVVAVALIAVILSKMKKRPAEAIEVDFLSLKDVVGFFKKPSTLEKLKASPDKLAVAVREGLGDGKTDVVLTLFDAKSNAVEMPLAVYRAKEIGPELLKLFGDKDMIVIK